MMLFENMRICTGMYEGGWLHAWAHSSLGGWGLGGLYNGLTADHVNPPQGILPSMLMQGHSAGLLPQARHNSGTVAQAAWGSMR